MFKQYPERTLDRITGFVEVVLLIGGCITGMALMIF